jgi:hypothetical protein
MQALVLDSCSSGYDFAIPSSRLYLAIQTLGVAMRFVGNYALCGLSPQTDGMPVIQRKKQSVIITDCQTVDKPASRKSERAGFLMV